MKYKSTRGGVKGLSFQEAVLSGLADDEGLLIPDHVPNVADQLQKWSTLSFVDLSLELMSLYVSEDEIPRADLKKLIEKGASTFSHPEVTPVVKVGDLFILELFHGPTFSFKDVALQFLGNLFEYILEKQKSHITVVGATSGDTGSAAIHGLKGKKNVDIFILFPKGRVSKVQELQMITVLDSNVHSLSMNGGSFDDCQSVVKNLFADLDFKKKHKLGAINSINWSRIMSQIIYYFYAYFQVKKQLNKDVKLIFSVPTGNFGDIVAGYYAKRMGLPIDHLIVATNANDILHRFFSKGEYHKAQEVIPTCTPSMDIQVASNFERYLYYLSGEDSSQVQKWMSDFKTSGKLTISGATLAQAQSDFLSSSIQHEGIESTIKSFYHTQHYLMDPHTAVGVAAAQEHRASASAGHAMVCLSTAHPAKFGEIVNKCTGGEVDVLHTFAPARALVEAHAETRCEEVGRTVEEVKALIERILAKNA
eukprot:Phypoly_transcript_08096.p1 GENE.Phypoly_transcript_08096~~Phypoly_transcript_08096.p1  ORF type:complete len:478 (+),score=83.80 Phypoly_transcript_08096:101-1534(+)